MKLTRSTLLALVLTIGLACTALARPTPVVLPALRPLASQGVQAPAQDDALPATTALAIRRALITPEEQRAKDEEFNRKLQGVSVIITQEAVVATASAAGAPLVGAFLSQVIGYFFTPDGPKGPSPMDIWESIKDYAATAIKAAIDMATLDNIDKQLQGIAGTVLKFRALTEPSAQKTQAFTTITELFTQLTPQFTRGPSGLVPYLVPFGTMNLAFMRELVTNYTSIYDMQDPNAEANHASLKDTIKTLVAATKTAIDSQVNERAHKVTSRVVYAKAFGCGLFRKSSDCGDIYTEDSVTGYSSTTSFDNNNVNVPGLSTAQAIEGNNLNAWGSTASAIMATQLRALSAPAFLWPLLDPKFEAGVVPQVYDVTTGMFGGRRGTAFPDQPASRGVSSRLTSVTIHGGNGIDGLQFAWGGVADRLIGGASGSAHPTLTMADGEYINRIQVANGDAVDYLKIYTNLGRSIEGGRVVRKNTIDIDFSSPLLSVSLCGVRGKEGTSNVEGITFVWCATEIFPDKAYV